MEKEDLRRHCHISGENDYDDDWFDPRETPMDYLKAFMWKLYSNQSVDQSRDCCLNFKFIVISRQMITLLRPLLLCDEAFLEVTGDNNMDTSSDTTTTTTCKITPPIFSSARMKNNCRFLSEAEAIRWQEEDNACTPEDKRCFFAALARCSNELTIENCPEIVSGLLSIQEIDHLEAECLRVAQSTSLTELEYARLGAIIQRSVKVTKLTLQLPFGDLPQSFWNSCANSIQIQSLCLSPSFGTNHHHTSSSKAREECGAVLLQAVIENPLITCVDNGECFPQCPLLWHYCSLNRAGRKYLTRPQEHPSIPNGLWPLFLSRAGRNTFGEIRNFIRIDDGKIELKYSDPVNAVYFFLRNSLCSWLQH